MELWIRSQQKEMLFKVNSSLIIRHNEDITNGAYFIECDKKKIAMYKTRERALEVLDEIQNILKSKCIMNIPSTKSIAERLAEQKMILQNYNDNAKIEELSTYVYQMPEE